MKMVCLANSWRPGGHCVAGIDLESGEWIRPVPKGAKAIPDPATHFGNHDLEPLDVVEFDAVQPDSVTKYQRENRIIRAWKLVDPLNVTDVIKYCDKSPSVLHGTGKVVDPEVLEAMKPDKWKSLELRLVEDAVFSKDPKKNERWIVTFSIGTRSYSLSVTDPVATAQLNSGKKVKSKCLLTLSLTEPIAIPKFNLPALCYKLAAAVVEL